MSETRSFREIFARIEAGTLGTDDVSAAFEAILSGGWTSVQIGAFAAALRVRGETAETIACAAGALRRVMTTVDHGLPEVIDTCGTGGDGAQTLNVSTAAAIVAAACGAKVAKHGNRSVSSRSGSADVIEALGIPIDLTPTQHRSVLLDAGITFMMAPLHHPALRHAAEARRELGIRTVFNALGPLANPARANLQLLGVYDDALRPVMADALKRIGVRRGWIVRSTDGLDEISPSAPTKVSVLDGDAIHERSVTPADFGVAPVSLDAIRGGDASENATAILRILRGDAVDAAAAVVVNAAAAIAIFRATDDLRQCARDASAALASGTALRAFEAWRTAARNAKAAP